MNDDTLHKAINRIRSITLIEVLTTAIFAMLFATIVILLEVKTAFVQERLTPGIYNSSDKLPSELVTSYADNQRISSFMLGHPYIIATEVISVSLSLNTQSPLLVIHRDSREKVSNLQHPGSLFTTNHSNNTVITAMLNGQFSCVGTPPKSDTAPVVLTTCRVPVPPYYGELTGYIVFHVDQELSIYQVDALRRHALRMAVELYYNNDESVKQ